MTDNRREDAKRLKSLQRRIDRADLQHRLLRDERDAQLRAMHASGWSSAALGRLIGKSDVAVGYVIKGRNNGGNNGTDPGATAAS